MPEYDYQCEKCGKEFSLRMGISQLDMARVRCPDCESEETKRVISGFVTHTSRKS